jgi:hypothetical protein
MRPGVMGAGAYATCAVDGCGWMADTDEPSATRTVARFTSPADTIDDAISRASRDRAAELEVILREHAESHDVLDYLRTIQRLNADLAQQGSGIRPHVYPQEQV